MSQCEHIGPQGQCEDIAVTGGRHCIEHAHDGTQRVIQQYLITNKLIGESAERHAKQDHLKSLVGEISLLRSLFEKRINMSETDADLVAATPALKDLAGQIEKLVISTHTMDVKLGNLLGKGALVSLAQDLIGIIDTHIRPFADGENPPTSQEVDEAIERIGMEIVESIASKENQT